MTRAPIICLEGPSAVGKTSLARVLAQTSGARVVPELDASGAPPIESAEPWFTQAHVERWQMACRLSECAPLVVIDCDPLKGLWYNWMYAEEGWPQLDIVGTLYRDRVRRNLLQFPDLYIFLDATESELWARRNADSTRSRRAFEKHVRCLEHHRSYFMALQKASPRRVSFHSTTDRVALAARVRALVAALPWSQANDSQALLEEMIRWIRLHSPAASNHSDGAAFGGENP